jgi:beta-glucanase (GH16 family)
VSVPSKLLSFLVLLLLTISQNRSKADWNIIWSDEFNGNSVDSTHWTFETGNGSGGWGNNELEYYTSRPQNVFVSGGTLHIVARKESLNGFSYTSARMKSAGLFSRKYGRFEFRAKLPQGQGYWPACWLMPQDSVYGGWAASGEIDVMENRGSNPSTVLGTLHYGGPWPNNVHSGADYVLPNGGSVTNFHTYMLEWSTYTMKWFVDGLLYQTQNNWYSSNGTYPAPFDQPFYLIMNLAVGGNFDGNPGTNTVFPGEMQVDYVRVYDQTAPLKISISKTNGTVLLSWPTNILCHLQFQTNSIGSSANWNDLPAVGNPYTLPPAVTTTAFYRLQSP